MKFCYFWIEPLTGNYRQNLYLATLIYIFFTTLISSLNYGNLQGKFPQELAGKVIGVLDGDTIDILYQGKALRIRLAHIDCPELRKKQPYGAAAKKFSSDLCFGKTVRILHRNELDRSNRLIGEVITPEGKNLNQELVKAGLAWHFIKYSSRADYSHLEAQARKNRIGLWKEVNPVAPWNWRKLK